MTGFSTSQLDPEGGSKPERNDGSYVPQKLISFHFFGNYSEQEKQIFESVQEQDLQKICFFLVTDLTSMSGMTYNVYDSREGKQSADPNHSISRASARFNEFAIYRFWEKTEDMHFPHEMTHLVAHRWGDPYQFETDLDTAKGDKIHKTIDMVSTSFMQEGLAIAVDDMLFNRQLQENQEKKFIDDFCREQIDKQPYTLETVINLEGFGRLPNEVIVPFTASFSKFLIRKYGIKVYKEAYVAVKETLAPQENVQSLENIFGESEKTLLEEWRSTLLEGK